MISVVTINYNNAPGLLKTLESLERVAELISQLIIVDGKSTDESLDVLSQVNLSGIGDVQVICESDKGLYDAMNKGIAGVSGLYLIFMNSGDSFHSLESLERVSVAAQRRAPDFIYGDFIEVGGDGQKYTPARSASWLPYGMFTSHQAMLFKVSIIKSYAMEYNLSYRLAADYCFVAEFLSLSNSVEYVPVPVCYFDVSGVSNTKRFEALRENYVIRVQTLNMGHLKAALLYLAHFAHSLLKRNFKGLTDRLRGKVA
ncbi:glycosyltransferase [Microbulbifer sp. ARAS458-1]|uniref:glycosyltransferase n=1 Tax=Microbulbifer sp. ARAS458-1 TaxID=3140242 RepID=UPI0038780124